MISTDALIQEVLGNADADKIQKAFDNITKHPYAEYLCLYGAGIVGVHLNEIFTEYGIKVDFFSENDGGTHVGTYIHGKPVLSYSELLQIKEKTLVIIANGVAYECWQQLKMDGFTHVNHINEFQIEHMDLMKSINPDVLLSDINKLRELLYDSQSFEIAMIWLNEMLKINYDFEIMHRIHMHNQYLPSDIFSFSNGESLVDVGAFDGDTVGRFVTSIPHYKEIHAIEMSKMNYAILVENTRHFRNIKHYNVGVSDKCGEVTFSEYSRAAKIQGENTKNSSSSVKVITLDNLLTREHIDFIKMDIEGAELAALYGAERIIRKQKPKCAICVYHNPENIYRIPLLLKKFVPEYKIFLKHHTDLLYETVCYATL